MGENNNNKVLRIIITVVVIIILALSIVIGVVFTLQKDDTEVKIVDNNNKENVLTDNQIAEINKAETVIDNTIIDDETQFVNRKYGRVEIVWVNKNNEVIADPLAPILNSMTPVKYSEKKLKFEDTTKDDSEWYNYSDQKWANAVDDGSYFVWIPRYAYKITYYSDNRHTKEIGYSDSRGILKLNNDGTLTKVYSNTPGLTEIGNHYILAPAFMKDTASGFRNGGWDGNLSGIWVAKFEMSMEINGNHADTNSYDAGDVQTDGNTKAVSKPSVTSWRNISIGNSYLNSYNYNRTYESHMMKNSEWGAISYLTYSKYGRNGVPLTLNQSNQYITGGDKVEANVYNYNKNQSTTGNATGIYDLSGNAWELIAAFTSNGYFGLKEYGGTEEESLLENENNTKYKTVYSHSSEDIGADNYNQYFANKNYSLTTGRRGEAIFETSISGYGSNGWDTNSSFFVQQDTPFFTRGGDFASGTGGGIFSFNSYNGQSDAGESFRVILAME